jgi:IS5 family transposase
MKPRSSPDTNQSNFLMPDLSSMLDQRQALCRLARAIDWESFENAFAEHYDQDQGTPGKPIRLMVGLLILKQLHDLSDDVVVDQWVQNPYFQFFTGEVHFHWKLPIDPTSLTRFRNRIGSEGCELILKESIRLHGCKAVEKTVIADTTVQEKNITFPTDAKQYRKICQKCVAIAQRHEIKLRRSYRRTIPKLMKAVHNRSHPKRAKQARKAERKLRTIAGRLVRELRRKLSSEALENLSAELDLFDRVLSQKRHDKNKIYSLHELEVSCISKGKDHKKYEFGQKASITRTLNSGIIVGALSFEDNRHDSRTLPDVLDQVESLTGKRPQLCLNDLGYRGRKQVGLTRILLPAKPAANASPYEKSKLRKLFRKRAGIEPVIGHLKSDFRLRRNFLKGLTGDQINLVMAAADFNFRKWMNLLTFLRSFCKLVRSGVINSRLPLSCRTITQHNTPLLWGDKSNQLATL